LWPFFDCHGKCFFAVTGRHDVVAFGKKTDAIDFSQAFVVFD
jgi:hypothetical protein